MAREVQMAKLQQQTQNAIKKQFYTDDMVVSIGEVRTPNIIN